MASPSTRLDRLNSMNDFGGFAVQRWVYEHLDFDAEILDVGAGWGKYRNLLPDYPSVDAVEVWSPYVDAEHLHERYRHVMVTDVTCLAPDILYEYDAVIFGDVLEHLSVANAKVVLKLCRTALVVVPFEYEQDAEEGGNPYEAHLQPELTEALVIERYPELESMEIEWRDGVPFKEFYVKEEQA
jgi:hypothetical protein